MALDLDDVLLETDGTYIVQSDEVQYFLGLGLAMVGLIYDSNGYPNPGLSQFETYNCTFAPVSTMQSNTGFGSIVASTNFNEMVALHRITWKVSPVIEPYPDGTVGVQSPEDAWANVDGWNYTVDTDPTVLPAELTSPTPGSIPIGLLTYLQIYSVALPVDYYNDGLDRSLSFPMQVQTRYNPGSPCRITIDRTILATDPTNASSDICHIYLSNSEERRNLSQLILFDRDDLLVPWVLRGVWAVGGTVEGYMSKYFNAVVDAVSYEFTTSKEITKNRFHKVKTPNRLGIKNLTGMKGASSYAAGIDEMNTMVDALKSGDYTQESYYDDYIDPR